jgi:hypothetical protein
MHERPSSSQQRALALAQSPCWLGLSLLCALNACTGGLSQPNRPAASDGEESAPASEEDPSGVGGTGSGAVGAGSAIGMSSAELHCDEQPIDPGPAPLGLLSREQYLNTLRDLFGAAGDVNALLAQVDAPSAFGLAQGDVSQLELEDFQQAAEAVAAKVVADKNMLASLVPCTGTDKRACAKSFLTRFGARAYRAPISDAADIERHLKLYDLGAPTSHEHGIELLLAGLLQSPRFLYRVEIGTTDRVADAAVKLSGYEVAARLSYVFWKSLPDDMLTEAARSGALATREGVAKELTRVLATSKGKLALRQFLESLIHLEKVDGLVKDKTLYPEWQNKALRSALTTQAQTFLSYVLDRQDGALGALLTSPTVFANKDLASFYGVTAGDSFTVVEPSAGVAAGLLSLPALLAIQAKPSESSPIYRGRFVRESLLCEQLPSPPANVPKPPEVQAGVSTRERLRQHEVDPSCSGCHQRLDPVGFGFENFDAIGRYRANDGGKPVDAHGEIMGSQDADGKFDGVAALGERLAASEQVRQCMTRQWFRFALGRFEQKVDACAVAKLDEAFAAQDDSLNALPAAIIASDAFLYRRPIDFQEQP